MKTISLTEDQKKLFKEYVETSNQATAQAQMVIEVANTKRKALEDLITMFCISNGLVKEKTKIDPIIGTATQEE